MRDLQGGDRFAARPSQAGCASAKVGIVGSATCPWLVPYVEQYEIVAVLAAAAAAVEGNRPPFQVATAASYCSTAVSTCALRQELTIQQRSCWPRSLSLARPVEQLI